MICTSRRQSPALSRERGGELLELLKEKVAIWWLPDEVIFVDELLHAATIKMLKPALGRV